MGDVAGNICLSLVVGGMETLANMERMATDAGDKPIMPITITGATVFTNPYKARPELALRDTSWVAMIARHVIAYHST